MKKSELKKYAHAIAKVGANVQKGQYVKVFANVDQELLVSYVVAECYKLGAKKVAVEWGSDLLDVVNYKKASVKALSEVPEWRLKKAQYEVDTNPVMIYIESSDPDALRSVDAKKINAVSKIVRPIMKPFRDQRENKYQWVIVGAASPAWAKKVFPELPKSKATEKLWEAILYTARCNGDPIKNWDEHNKDLIKRTNFLNSLDIDFLEYHAGNGTNFKVWLNSKVNWLAGGETALGSNIYYNPNMPSEECFTSPIKGKAEGIVYASKPLSYQGQLIENFSITFKDGKAVDCHAEKNEALLREMIASDENSGYLGEVALVPHDSPISNSNILFYNTLYDENAACHLALGRGFTNLVKGYENYTQQELFDMGINNSTIHVDFMVGTSDMDIVAHLRDGSTVQIFKNGNWAF